MKLLFPHARGQHQNQLRRFVGYAVSLVIISGYLAWGPIFAQVAGPTLSIPQALPAMAGQPVTVPIDLQTGETAVASIVFSIDFDQTCLGFDSSDNDHDGLFDNVHFNMPAAFRGSVSYTAADLAGELDFVIADFAPPIATLPNKDGLVTITFTPLCMPAADAAITATVGFAHAPMVSFGGPDGNDLSGATSDGAVEIHAPGAATVTPTATLTPSATPLTTATSLPTAPATPTFTATAAVTPNVTVTLTPTATPMTEQSPQALHVFLPWIKR